MSPTEKDRNLRTNDGTGFPATASADRDGRRFVEEISLALRREYGGTPGSVKVIARLTQANERAVKNWLDGKNAPNGANLMILMRCSDEVLESVLRLSDRHELIVTRKFAAARDKLREMLRLIDDLEAED